MEQQYVPSQFSRETTIAQAECDAPDAGTCLQWVQQARRESPQIVCAYILWARGMTAQSAIASGECKPDLDAQIKDDDGIAVFTAPMPDLSTDVLADALAETVDTLAKAKPEAWVGYEAPVEVLRALTLLETTVGSMREALDAQWAALSAPPPSPRNKPTAVKRK